MLKRIFLAVMLVIGGLAMCGCEQPAAPAPVGFAATTAEFPNWNVGEKVLVFSTPDCVACRRDKPALNYLRSRRTDVEFIEIDARQHPEVAREFGVDRYPTYVRTQDGHVTAFTTSIKIIFKVLKIVFMVAMFFI